MRPIWVLWCAWFVIAPAFGGVPQSEPVDTTALSLSALLREATESNPGVQAAQHSVAMAGGRARQAGVLAPPELMYMRERMPDFKWSAAMMQRIGLYQMVPFPSKLGGEDDLAGVQERQSLLTYQEKLNETRARVRSTYASLWYAQQSLDLTHESERILRQVAQVAETRVGVGAATLEDALKTSVELSRTGNRISVLQQQELSAAAALAALLNRPEGTVRGRAVLQEKPQFEVSLDSLQQEAQSRRPMLARDSLMIAEGTVMAAQAEREYLPDFRVGVEYVTEPAGAFRGWSVVAALSLPIMPWSLARPGGMSEEAEAATRRSEAAYREARADVRAAVRDAYLQCRSGIEQVTAYQNRILPEARRSLQASMTAYQTGRTDILMVLDAHRMYVDLALEALMARMAFEQSYAVLEKEVGRPLQPDQEQ